MSKRIQLSNKEFLKRVDEYLPGDSAVFDTDAQGNAGSFASFEDLTGNTFYLLDSETMLAVSHAIEELAMDEANGRLLASFQNFSAFASHREKYRSMADTIDDVVVVGSGRKPRPAGRIKFISADKSAMSAFWVVLYQGRRTHALLMSRQCNEAEEIEAKRFTGFYTFDERLIARVRHDIECLLGGVETELVVFDRLQAVDQAVKHVRSVFGNEQALLEVALHKLQANDTCESACGPFLRILEQSLQRLEELKTRLPEMLASHSG